MLWTVNINGTVTNFITDARYLPYGPALSWSYGNGLTRLLPRDLDGRLATTFTKNGTTAIQNPSYTYNAFGRLTAVVKSGATTNYWVNALGQRTHKTQGSPQATEFLYGTDGQLLAEYHQVNGWTRYLWMGDELVGVVKGSAFHRTMPDNKKPLIAQGFFLMWCPGEDSNLHGFTR